ncbi:hypothetical protein DC522_01260 [Microvirga sp. KLBC 81]|nr:hypothetical protein DC522_01260 [Microvirga sp. KLBC 81]
MSVAGMSLEVERLIALFDHMALVLRAPDGLQFESSLSIKVMQGGVDCSIAFDQWIELDSAIVAPTKRGKSVSGALTGIPEGRRFLAALPREVAGHFKPEDPVEISPNGAHASQGISMKATPSVPADLTNGLGPALARSLIGSIPDDIAMILAADITVKPIDASEDSELEHIASAGNGLVVSGWIANLADRTIHITSEDLRTWLFKSSLKAVARPDVHTHLRQEKRLTSASNEHGFAFVMPHQPDKEQALYFVEVSPDGRDVIFHGPLQATPEQDEALALDLVSKTFGDIRSLPIEQVDRTYRLLLSPPKGEMRAQVFDFGPGLQTGKPLSSIIIPFYGDAFFLNCVHYLQRILDDSFELVLVVDDPRIWDEIYNGLSLRSHAIRVTTRLLRNFANYGYGGANNLGANLARGDVLFLMNSDILVKDAQGLVKAAETIRGRKQASRPELLIGFSLLYEDNTIQHVGIEFMRSSMAGDFFLADHPLKGLPFAFYKGDAVRHVPAVTGALMALSKDLFSKLGGFDPAFVRGDFEDADLCLRARRMGAEIQLHVHPGLYHLERQSVPAMGDADIQSAINYINCVEFNRRWAAELSRPKRVFKISGGQAPSGTGQ